MAVIKCENGHYYDDKKYDKCPHCEKGLAKIRKETYVDDLNNVKTQGIEYYDKTADEPLSTRKNTDITIAEEQLAAGKEGATIGIHNIKDGTGLVAGWLVGIKGKYRGRDYKIYGGWNKIGRGIDMDIYLPDDMKISAAEHAAIVFDNKNCDFYLISRRGNLTYLNGELSTDSSKIKTGDQIGIGDSLFIFIAFCTEERKWENI